MIAGPRRAGSTRTTPVVESLETRASASVLFAGVLAELAVPTAAASFGGGAGPGTVIASKPAAQPQTVARLTPAPAPTPTPAPAPTSGGLSNAWVLGQNSTVSIPAVGAPLAVWASPNTITPATTGVTPASPSPKGNAGPTQGSGSGGGVVSPAGLPAASGPVTAAGQDAAPAGAGALSAAFVSANPATTAAPSGSTASVGSVQAPGFTAVSPGLAPPIQPTRISFFFDFGPATSPVAPGATGFALQTYTTTVGYGWLSASGLDVRDRGSVDPLTRDFVLGKDGTFKVDLPNGSYDVNPTLGDTSYAMTAVSISAQNQVIATGVSTFRGQFISPHYSVNVTNGQLDLRVASTSNSTFQLDGLKISPAVSASAGGPYQVAEGSAVKLNATASGGTAPYTYAWDLSGTGQYTTAGQSPSYTYPDEGSHVVGLKVTDAAGHTALATANVTVTAVAPTVTAGGPYVITVGLPLTLTGSATSPNPVDAAAGFSYAWNFGDGTTGTGAVPVHIYSAPGTYTVTVKATDVGGNTSAPATATVTVASAGVTIASSSQPQILLTPSVLTTLRQEAAANTPQWQAFKARLDKELGQVVEGGYEASEMQWVADFALGYQALMTIDPVTASAYADKAIAVMKSGLNDYQVSSWTTRQFLAQGNGTTTTFTLPNADLVPSTLKVFVAPVSTVAVVRGAANGQDSVGNYQRVLKVSDTAGGPAAYAQGADWVRNTDLAQNLIDWSPAGKEPAAGATYYVTEATASSAPQVSNFTLKGNQITFTTAPTAGQAVYVEYMYGTHAANGSTLAYQQTSAGDGGFNSIFVDSSYTSRYLGPYMAIGLDWLSGYAGLNPALTTQVTNMLVRWSNYVRDYGYQMNYPASNYADGAYLGRMLTAIALNGRSPQGPQLVAEVSAYRQTYVLPVLQGGQPSLQGGFWAEGWSYGQAAAQNILLAGLAYETAGLGTATAERQWASQAIESLIESQPTPSTVYDGGTWYAYPAPFPTMDLIDLLAASSTNTADKSYANYIIQHYTPGGTNDFKDLLYHNPSAPSASWTSTMPLQYDNTGTGLVTARADWSYQSTWLSFQLGNTVTANHQTYSPGQLQVQRGADDLLVNASAVAKGAVQTAAQSTYSNAVVIDDNGDGAQTYRWSTGYWYGTPGVVMTNYEVGSNYVYAGGDYHAAYSTSQHPGAGGSATQLNRQVVYLRPDLVIVHDRAGTLKATYAKQLQWQFLNAPTLTGNNGFVESVGSSKLFGQTYSSVPVTTAAGPVTVGGTTLYQVRTNNAAAVLNVTYTTVLQSATSATTAMTATSQVQSTDGRMEGVQAGNQLVLFGKSGPVDMTAGPVTYSANGSAPVSNLLTDLQPGRSYNVTVNGALLTTKAASSQGTLSFTTPAGPCTVVIS